VVIFDSAMTPATFWVKLNDLDLKPGAPVKKLQQTLVLHSYENRYIAANRTGRRITAHSRFIGTGTLTRRAGQSEG
jgi:hypothetical protein